MRYETRRIYEESAWHLILNLIGNEGTERSCKRVSGVNDTSDYTRKLSDFFNIFL